MMFTKDMASSVVLTVGGGFAEMPPDILKYAEDIIDFERPTNLEIVKCLENIDEVKCEIKWNGNKIFSWAVDENELVIH